MMKHRPLQPWSPLTEAKLESFSMKHNTLENSVLYSLRISIVSGSIIPNQQTKVFTRIPGASGFLKAMQWAEEMAQ